jgi:16S rRNA (guanine(966)-N(2))-methyltransferase RsmD
LRVISGKIKGIRFSVPKKFPSRPTTDFAKEGLFNVLNNQFSFENAEIIDLFSGTGNISYEFASRGAKRILSVEQNLNCTKYIRETTTKHQLNSIQVIQSDVFQFLQKTQTAVDLVFADPPYDFKKYTELIGVVLSSNLLKNAGLFILEHSKHIDFSHVEHFTYLRNYGGVCFSFFEIERHA